MLQEGGGDDDQVTCKCLLLVIRCCQTYRSLVQCGKAWLLFLGFGPVQKGAGYVVGNVDATWAWVLVLQAGGHGATRRGFSDVDDELILSPISSH